MEDLGVSLLMRAIGQRKPRQTIKRIYAHRSWVQDLDIINELGGHTGCVNALNWSTSGGLLASGSDDTYLNIWDYNPANLAKPFTLNTSVSTGHRANIFSVKFMPHSSDRTVVTCAGDSEVRVFDLEYSGANQTSQGGEATSSSTRSRRFDNFFGNARWLSDANTNARVYRCHSDRAKRIVTESSPHLFLSCSEDGEVRQWDLRQPSSYYPAPHGVRRMGRFRTAVNDDASTHVPAPLISYKKYDLDLNSISCSPSQPHYIALGGSHLHCFLHDRRMLGRDLSAETGRPSGLRVEAGTRADETMREATKCVRRFAPNQQRRVRGIGRAHITACKISDARPNELIASWSGDQIYSFDIVKSPDAAHAEAEQELKAQRVQQRHESLRKRKRTSQDDIEHSHNPELAAPSTRQASSRDGNNETVSQTAHSVREISRHINQTPPSAAGDAVEQGRRVGRLLVSLRKTLFDFSARLGDEEIQAMENTGELTPFKGTFTKALGQAASLLSQMNEIIQSWLYPMNPDDDTVQYQNTLRRNRQASWRFVQAGGCLAASLGGRLQTLSATEDPRMASFVSIQPAPREGRHISDQSRFYYDFLRAILLWVNGGAVAVLEDFTNAPDGRLDSPRYPFARNTTLLTLGRNLENYLLGLVETEKPILDLGANRFERDEYRKIFDTQPDAVRAFVRALDGIELRDHQGLSEVEPSHSGQRIMDKGAAARFWVLKVGRSLLLEAAEGVTFSFAKHAFGGRSTYVVSEIEDLGHLPVQISDDEEGQHGEGTDITLLGSSVDVASTDSYSGAAGAAADDDDDDDDDDDNDQLMEQDDEAHNLINNNDNDDEDDGNDSDAANNDLPDDDNNDDDNDDDDDNDENDSSEDDEYSDRRYAPAYRASQRATVNNDVRYSSHTKVYKGHCNTRTVKDVNYYGLDDEYVVSGSDDGHFFIWDRKTCEIVNILKGDEEVVNVVQGHPYEPIIACSGIDSSIKIFGPGGASRERYDAIKGINIANPGEVAHSSLRYGQRSRTSRDSMTMTDNNDVEVGDENIDIPQIRRPSIDSIDEDVSLADNGLQSRQAMKRCYEITSQNDVMRRDSVGDALMSVSADAMDMLLLRAWVLSNSVMI